MKITLTMLEYELLKAFQQLTKEEKTIVLEAAEALLPEQEASSFSGQITA